MRDWEGLGGTASASGKAGSATGSKRVAHTLPPYSFPCSLSRLFALTHLTAKPLLCESVTKHPQSTVSTLLAAHPITKTKVTTPASAVHLSHRRPRFILASKSLQHPFPLLSGAHLRPLERCIVKFGRTEHLPFACSTIRHPPTTTAHTHTHHITPPPPQTTLPCALTTRKTHATQQKAAPYAINTDGLARTAVNQHHILNLKQKNIPSTYHALQHQFMIFNRFLAHARRFNCICDRSTRCLATDPPTRSVASAESSSQAPRSSVELCHLPDRVALTAALPRAPPTPSQQRPQMPLNCSQPTQALFQHHACHSSIDASGCSKANISLSFHHA